ncbi:MAG: hypothetical protein F6K19_41190 [Cyanothece sp. SIO1E1]|nr:hypothetical protein [Cyanothece sp. SIO1E1]
MPKLKLHLDADTSINPVMTPVDYGKKGFPFFRNSAKADFSAMVRATAAKLMSVVSGL